MSEYVNVTVGELFVAHSGKPLYIRDFIDSHPGDFPVYSASLVRPFGYVDRFDYEGPHLTWVMNGYGGRVQEVDGRFAATRDRGVLVPREEVATPDLTYLRFALEPQMVAAAVGRRVDGRLNEYTKIYPGTAEAVTVALPLDEQGNYDYARMEQIGDRLRRVEQAQNAVRASQEPLMQATFTMDLTEPSRSLLLGDGTYFKLSIGDRVLRKEHVDEGVPVYSANALVPFGSVSESNLEHFDNDSLLWGIDGIFDWNMISAGQAFATTDHCGRLQILGEKIDSEYVYWYLKSTRERYGFDRVFRASLQNVKAEVRVVVPLGADGEPSLSIQRELAREMRSLYATRSASLISINEVLRARLTAEL